jgi:hypothetical protein
VHKAGVVACLLTPGAGGRPHQEIWTFGPMPTDLLGLVDWLVRAECGAVAMESTGSFGSRCTTCWKG